MIFNEDHEVREVRLNASHPAQVTPSWHGDAVGHYEGDTLVVDTVGIRADRPFAMIDLFGTPYTSKLHVVERYSLLDRDAAKDLLQRAAKENWRPGGPADPNYKDKYLRIQFTVEDAGPTRRRGPPRWFICATAWNGRKSSAPKTRLASITTRMPMSRARARRIFDRRNDTSALRI